MSPCPVTVYNAIYHYHVSGRISTIALFADPNLEAAVRTALGKPTGELTSADLARLTSLDARFDGSSGAGGEAVRDLAGIENCTNLTDLECSGNSISDITPLSDLPRLRTIHLEANRISDISPLVENAGLSDGSRVYLQRNNLDLSPDSEDMRKIAVLKDRGITLLHDPAVEPCAMSAGRARRVWIRLLSVVLILALLAGLGALGYTLVTPYDKNPFTEFYILGETGQAADYPHRLAVGEIGAVILGIANREGEEVSYRVEVVSDGVKTGWIGSVVMVDDEEWEREVTFSMGVVGEDQRVEFMLYKHGETEPYLTLHLWVDVSE